MPGDYDFYDEIEQVHQLVNDKFSNSSSLFSQFIEDTKTVLSALQDFQSLISQGNIENVQSYHPFYPRVTSTNVDSIPTPNLKQVTIPQLPDPPQLNYPNVQTTDLLDLSFYRDLISKIRNILLYGDTGIPSSVEDLIMNKAVEREQMELAYAEEKVISTWAGRGFTLPNDIINDKLSEIREKFYYQRLQTSREIAIKRYDIAFEAVKLALTVGSDLIKVATSLLDILPKVFVEIEKLKVEEYVAYINGIKSKLEATTAYNDSLVKAYTGLLQGETVKLQAKEIDAKIDLSATELEIRRFYQEAQLKLERSKAMLQIDLEKSKLTAEQQKAVATLYSNVSSAILQSMNTLVQLSSNYHLLDQ